MDEGFYLFLCLVLRKTDAQRHMDLFTRHRDKNLILELCSDSFRCNSAVRTCRHWQEDREFLATITISEIRLAQASFDYLAK